MKSRRRNKETIDREIYLETKGLNPDDVYAWRIKWQDLKSGAKKRGALCLLSFNQYIDLAIDAGLSSPNQIGCKPYLYQMGRMGDKGNYEIGNCRFITMSRNILEKIENGGTNLNRTKHSHPGVKRMSDANSKRYRVKSPDGIVYEGLSLNQFCKDKGLRQPNMSEVCRGIARQYKGWTGTYIQTES